MKIRLKRPTTGKEGLIESTGIALRAISPKQNGEVKVKGEIWQAASNETIKKNDSIKVVEVQGLVLHVRKLPRQVGR